MSNVTSEYAQNIEKHARSAEKKGKPGFTIQPVPANENAPGTLVRALGTRWGLDPSKVNPLGRTTRKVVQPQPIPGGLEPAQDEREAQPEDSSLDHPDKSGGNWHGDDPGQLGEPSGDWSRSLDQPERTGSDRPSKDSPEDQGLSYEMDNPHQVMELEENSPAVPGTDRNSIEARSSQRDMTDSPLTERTLPESQGDERSSVSNVQGTEELEEDPESSEGTWRQVRTRKSTNGSDDSEVERNLLEENADSKSRGRPSRYFQDWFDSKNNKSGSNPEPDELDEPSKNREQ